MKMFEETYKEIYENLKSFCREQEFLHFKKENILRKSREQSKQLKVRYDKDIKENAEREKKLLAFIDIAKAHATNLIDTNDMQVFDTGILSRLMVQIDNASKNDKYAEQLFLCASNQLRYLRRDVYSITQKFEHKKQSLSKECHDCIIKVDEEIKKLEQKISDFLYSSCFDDFLSELKTDYLKFGNAEENGMGKCSNCISIGVKKSLLPIPRGCEKMFSQVMQELFDSNTCTVGIPVIVDLAYGKGMFIDYTNENESILLRGIQNLLMNIARYMTNEFEQILYVDPIRYNASSLGSLQILTGYNDSFIDSVPISMEEMKKKVSSLIADINAEEKKWTLLDEHQLKKRLIIFHTFPNAYDSTLISQIRQLFVNASHYNLYIIVTNNKSLKNVLSSDSIDLIKSDAFKIECDEKDFSINDGNGNVWFEWYQAPLNLPEDIRKKLVDERPITDTSNDYEKRIGLNPPLTYTKGVRRLTDIPYGIDEYGSVLTLDFENSNFATFVCGASRSGKSTLLHTIITSIIKNNHPDDVELWLIDFKMTEFSRYITHLPPHVRYIILDESPELVFDIIDRLTEILIKRQSIFKGKWQKLDEVPKDKYMPAIFVIIDEFSVMSYIIADALMTSKENYVIKLQTLLAKGAALGFHFIFASQGFTSGTRGLNDFSKKQIQQRIAMKTEYNEIKETLDLKSASDDDKAMMEQLPVHYALVRNPIDEMGNHLKLIEVLYIKDYSKQESMIDSIKSMMHVAPRYEATDVSTYIDKKSMIVDGNEYITFISRQSEMNEYIKKHEDELFEDDKVFMFVGAPRRMMPLYPIEIVNGYCENLLLISPIEEKMATSSVLMSIACSLKIVNKEIDMWTTRKNPIYRQIVLELGQAIGEIAKDLDEVCCKIREIKEMIMSKQETNKYIVILGAETLIMDMGFQLSANGVTGLQQKYHFSKIEKRADGELDLISRLRIAENEDMRSEEGGAAQNMNSNLKENSGDLSEVTESYDARNDLKFILTQGSKLGYHFIMVFNSVGEVNQSKVDTSLFKHKILFRIAKLDAASIVGSTNASAVSELENHSFRYTNGLETLSFRPYLHSGLSWDGWKMSGTKASSGLEEEEYLM